MLPYYLAGNARTNVTFDLEPDSDGGLAGSATKMADYVVKNARPGSIILLHVMYGSRSESLKAVPLIIEGLRAKGFEFVTVSELLGAEPL